MGRVIRALLLLLLLGVLALAAMMAQAMAEPVVRRASLTMTDWPAGAETLRVAFVGDVHVAGPDMPPSRLRAIVAQVNSLDPDLVLLGGDYVSDKRTATRHYSAREALAPLAQLRPRLGSFAVLGNHDHWRSENDIRTALKAANIRLLDNGAITAGPLRLGGVDDDFTGRADVGRTVAAMRAGPGARVLITHSPDIVPSTPNDISLILAGHTHCGQIRLPLIGAVSYMSDYGERYACGLTIESSKRVITTAGLGTSVLPLRLGAPPEVWLLTLGPAQRRSR